MNACNMLAKIKETVFNDLDISVVATMEEFQFPITNLEKTRAFSNYNTTD